MVYSPCISPHYVAVTRLGEYCTKYICILYPGVTRVTQNVALCYRYDRVRVQQSWSLCGANTIMNTTNLSSHPTSHPTPPPDPTMYCRPIHHLSWPLRNHVANNCALIPRLLAARCVVVKDKTIDHLTVSDSCTYTRVHTHRDVHVATVRNGVYGNGRSGVGDVHPHHGCAGLCGAPQLHLDVLQRCPSCVCAPLPYTGQSGCPSSFQRESNKGYGALHHGTAPCPLATSRRR